MINKNKLLYWLNFLQTQVGEDASVILIGTKYDIMRNQFGTVLDLFARERLSQINAEIKRLIKRNKIKLKIHKFDAMTVFKPGLKEEQSRQKQNKKNPAKKFVPIDEENYYETVEEEYSGIDERTNIKISDQEEVFVFFPLNNRELSREKSGISTIYRILANEYDNIQHSISTTLKHKIVYDMIQKLSGSRDQNGQIQKDNEKIKPFLDVAKLKQELILQGEREEQQEAIIVCNEIEIYLVDLHKLGVIIFFDHDILRETIICTPEFFNKVFKSILDHVIFSISKI